MSLKYTTWGSFRRHKMNNVYGFSVKKINGEKATLNDYKGKVILIVNVADLMPDDALITTAIEKAL
jgi:hypothetical protein